MGKIFKDFLKSKTAKDWLNSLQANFPGRKWRDIDLKHIPKWKKTWYDPLAKHLDKGVREKTDESAGYLQIYLSQWIENPSDPVSFKGVIEKFGEIADAINWNNVVPHHKVEADAYRDAGFSTMSLLIASLDNHVSPSPVKDPIELTRAKAKMAAECDRILLSSGEPPADLRIDRREKAAYYWEAKIEGLKLRGKYKDEAQSLVADLHEFRDESRDKQAPVLETMLKRVEKIREFTSHDPNGDLAGILLAEVMRGADVLNAVRDGQPDRGDLKSVSITDKERKELKAGYDAWKRKPEEERERELNK